MTSHNDDTVNEVVFSVVIPTYNHAELLRGALETVCRQAFDERRYEVIVVDNNSTDGTRSVVEAFATQHRGVRYCLEPTQGLNHARNCGWRNARGLYVAILDDDCRAPDEWLTVAAEIVERRSPTIFGGPYYTAFEGVKPSWVSENFNSYIPFPEPDARVLGRDEYGALVGGNVFIRRTVFDSVGGFDPSLGHVGKTVLFGDETEFFGRVSERYPGTFCYEPRLAVHHLVRREKLTLWFNVRASFGAGRSAVQSRRLHGARTKGRVLLDAGVTALVLIRDVLVRAPLRDRRKYPHVLTYIHDHTLEYVRRLGSLYEQAAFK